MRVCLQKENYGQVSGSQGGNVNRPGLIRPAAAIALSSLIVERNDTAVPVKALIEALTSARDMWSIAGTHADRKSMRDVVVWDLGHLALEIEYRGHLSTTVYRDKATLYLSGFFPCGWVSQPDGGKLVAC
jgi:hypothetical protein